VTFVNNFYLVLGGATLLMLVTGLLWPNGVFESWGRAALRELASLAVMAAGSFLPGFRWETRGLLLTDLALSLFLFLRQRKKKEKA
jgi:hypothetical protein